MTSTILKVPVVYGEGLAETTVLQVDLVPPPDDATEGVLTFSGFGETRDFAIAHGEGDTIAIRLLVDRLVIVDDGRGFDPESVPSDRFGLRSMRGRARLIGKRLDIDSQVGGPTSITFWLD